MKFQIIKNLIRLRVVVVMRHVVGPPVIVERHDGAAVVRVVVSLLLAVPVDGAVALIKQIKHY